MNKTPYSVDFLWHQIELGYKEIRKERYKNLIEQFLFSNEYRKRLEKKKDYKGRNYEGGMLETTASLISLSLCIYDNYPEIDIDLILTAFILYGFCSIFTKKECFEKIKDYPEVVPFLFKKQRKKPTLELTVFEQLIKLDYKIFERLQIKRKNLKI
ncbi:hypothetical protein [Hydrogenivirga sp. 128-5-R1-1]|uniref:hypothetical protein n=1 Tax=Hydrogenivirga sp. 128-5-R1-1 TaxID=392423 RepID=UPI00015F3911|nr:hypothetical protein [Hydrogenivirga sp. 128-5-R1-1]EDP73940.1 hypothetical protein HG1285_12412 [Hydrogenivirga sp. 128-5-R1-1]